MDCPLSPRQAEVLWLGYEGLDGTQTAQVLGIEASSVRSHWVAVRRKLDARSKGEAYGIALREGWVGEKHEGGLPIVVFRDLPEGLGLSSEWRVYLSEFDRMLAHHREYDGGYMEAAFSLGYRKSRPRPGNSLDGFYLKLLRSVSRCHREIAADAPFGDRGHVTDVPEKHGSA